MQVSIETTSGLERRLTVGVPAEVVDQEVVKRLKDASKTVRINGFRKGKVPLKVIKQRFGGGVRQEVLSETINKTFYEAMQDKSVRPAGQPSIEPTQMDEGKDLEYVATFEVYPEIDKVVTEGVEITKYDAEIQEQDIDTMIENLRKGQAQWVEQENAAADGDQVTIDFEGLKDGEAFDGGSAKAYDLVLGSGSMIPGFEDGIVGMAKGEEKQLDVTFPEDYQVENLQGAAVVFKVTVNTVKRQELPELDESFFEKFGVHEGGVEKFREDVKSNMEREKQKALKTKTKQQILDGLLKQNPIELPQSLVRGEIDALRTQMVQQYGAVADKLDVKALLPDEMFKEQAERRTALGLLVSELVSAEGMSADKDRVRQLVEEAAASYEDPQEVINYYYSDSELLRNVEAAALEDQVVAFVLDKAAVTEVIVPYEEALKPLDAKLGEDEESSAPVTE